MKAAAGFNAVIVNYSTGGGGTFPCQIKQPARAIEITREHAVELRENFHIELHIYPKGGHGIQLTTERIMRSRSIFKRNYNWHGMSVDWLTDLFHM